MALNRRVLIPRRLAAIRARPPAREQDRQGSLLSRFTRPIFKPCQPVAHVIPAQSAIFLIATTVSANPNAPDAARPLARQDALNGTILGEPVETVQTPPVTASGRLTATTPDQPFLPQTNWTNSRGLSLIIAKHDQNFQNYCAELGARASFLRRASMIELAGKYARKAALLQVTRSAVNLACFCRVEHWFAAVTCWRPTMVP